MHKLLLTTFAISTLLIASIHAEEENSANNHKPATEGAELGKWTQDFDAAVKLAGEKSKPIFINFTGSDWCGWCKLMDKKVFAAKEWQDYAKENLLLVTIDFPRDKSIVPGKFVHRNEKLQSKYGVRGFPTFIVLDQDGETKVGQLGASQDVTPKSFVQQVEDVLRFTKSGIASFTAELSEGKTKEYKELLAALKAAEKKLTDWLETRPQRNDENIKKFTAMREDITAAKAKIKSFK
jgi:thioredoxin-related protein